MSSSNSWTNEILLFNFKQRLLTLGFFHYLLSIISKVSSSGCYLINLESLTNHQKSSYSFSKWVFAHIDGFEPNFGVASTRLIAWSPPFQFIQSLDGLLVNSWLWKKILACTINPDVFGECMCKVCWEVIVIEVSQICELSVMLHYKNILIFLYLVNLILLF